MLFSTIQEKVIDPFVIYKDGNFDYPSLRDSLCDALFGKQLARLEQACKVSMPGFFWFDLFCFVLFCFYP